MIPLGDGLYYNPQSGKVNTYNDSYFNMMDEYSNQSFNNITNGYGKTISDGVSELVSPFGFGSRAIYANSLRRMATSVLSATEINPTTKFGGLSPYMFSVGLMDDALDSTGSSNPITKGALYGGAALYMGGKSIIDRNMRNNGSQPKDTYMGKILKSAQEYITSDMDEFTKVKQLEHMSKAANAAGIASIVSNAASMGAEGYLYFGMSQQINKNAKPNQYISQSHLLNSIRNQSGANITRANMINSAAMLASTKQHLERLNQPARASFFNRN